MVEARRSPLKDQTDIRGSHCLVVEARFYDDIQDALLAGAVAELEEAGLFRVAGARTLPSVP